MRLVLVSDTHRRESSVIVPEGDVLIHAGDFDIYKHHHLVTLNKWFGKVGKGFKKVIFIGGNHDFHLQAESLPYIQKIVTNATYLQDSSVEVDGVKFYGTPWTPIFGSWAFMLTEKELKEKFAKIPEDTNVLISHGPAYGILDMVFKANGNPSHNVGSFSLLEKVKAIKPKIHVFGHIHCSFGKYTDYSTDYYNVAFCDDWNNPCNEPVVVDL